VLAGRLEDVGPYYEAAAQGYEPRDPAASLLQSPQQIQDQAKADANKSRRIQLQKDWAEKQLGRLDELSAGGFSHYAEITIEESDFRGGKLDHAKILAAVEAQTGKYASLELPGLASALGKSLEGAKAGDRLDISEIYSLAYNASQARAEAVADAIGSPGSIKGLSAIIGQRGYAPSDLVTSAEFGLAGQTVDYATLGLAAYQATRSVVQAGRAVFQEVSAAGRGSAAASPVNAGVGSGNLLGRGTDLYRTFRLRGLTTRAATEVDAALAAGDFNRLQALTGGSKTGWVREALAGGKGSARFRGLIIDDVVKNRAQQTFGLRSLRYGRSFEYGPDVWNPMTMRAWDITTPGQWPVHVTKYITSPPAARPVWRSLEPLLTR
jgi:hypothetical protein